MYIPKPFNQDTNSMIQTIQSIKLGCLIVYAENRFFTAHIPFLLKQNITPESTKNETASIILESHVARTNPIWTMAKPDNKAMVIFRAADAYIHPGWYPEKNKTGKVVPTWNYHAVHCYGYSEKEESEIWLLNHVTELTNDNELGRDHPWHVSDAPKDYIDTLVKRIVGIKVIVEKLEGSLKMNQHHSEENRNGVIQGLLKSNKINDHQVAEIMLGLKMKDK